MASIERRIQDIIKGLSAEDKARLTVQDVLRAEPVFSSTERKHILATLGVGEARKYYGFIARFDPLLENITSLSNMTRDLSVELLKRTPPAGSAVGGVDGAILP